MMKFFYLYEIRILRSNDLSITKSDLKKKNHPLHQIPLASVTPR